MSESDVSGVRLCYETRGESFVVRVDKDVADALGWFKGLCRHRSRGYPMVKIKTPKGWRSIDLHRFVMGPAPAGLQWDHINRDKLDNRRANLRAVTARQNQLNKSMGRSNTSGVVGVRLRRPSIGVPFWMAYINRNGASVHLGSFKSRREAIDARRRGFKEAWIEHLDAGTAEEG